MRSPAFAKIRPPPPSEPGLDDHDRMRITGLEPARRGHQNLNLARLPIPPHPLDLKLFKIIAEVFGFVNNNMLTQNKEPVIIK